MEKLFSSDLFSRGKDAFFKKNNKDLFNKILESLYQKSTNKWQTKQSYKYLKDTMSLKKLYEMCPGYTQNFKYTIVHIIIPYNFFRSVKKCLCQLNLFYCA